jgi:hypothetical protein
VGVGAVGALSLQPIGASSVMKASDTSLRMRERLQGRYQRKREIRAQFTVALFTVEYF